MSGVDAWLRINEPAGFTNGVYFGNSLIRTDSRFQLGNNGAQIDFYANGASSAATFKIPTNITSTLSVGGATTLTSATIDSAIVNDINVYGELKAAKYSIETVQNLGGHFLVCPTIEVPSQGNENSFLCQVTRPSDTSDKLTIIFTDNSLSTDTFEGAKWAANSKVKVTGMINNIALGTCDGTISNWATANKRVEISITCGTAISSKFSTSATPYTSDQVSNLSIMMYEVYTSNGTYPIGVYITSYGKNKYSYIDVYGGTSNTPSVRMGKLDGLPTVNDITPSGWGFYSDGGSDGSGGGYFGGKLVSPSGKIGGFTIGSDAIYSSINALGTTENNVYIGTEGISLGKTFKVTKAGALTATSGKIGNWNLGTALYSGTNSNTSTIAGTYLGTDGLRNYKDANTYVDIKNGVITAKAVDLTGKITASTGAIGGFEIVSTAIRTLNVAVTSNVDNSISLSSADFTRTINSTSRAGLRFAIGDKFGITGDGTLYANGANITAINAGNISTGYLSADRINANTLTIGKFTTADQNKILNDNLEIGGRNLIRNSNLFCGTGTNWTLPSGASIIEEDSQSILIWAQSSKNWNKILFRPYISANAIKGRTITVSAYVRGHNLPSTETNSWFYINTSFYNGKDDSTRSVYIDHSYRSSALEENKWVKISYTVSVDESLSNWSVQTSSVNRTTNSNYFTIELYNYSGTQIDFKQIKVEYGNKATDWTPAPEDVDVDIDDAAKTSTNFIVANENGIMVADMTGGAQTPSNITTNNVYIKNDGVLIRNGVMNLAGFESNAIKFYDGIDNNNGNVIASFGSTNSRIGRANSACLEFNNTGFVGVDEDNEVAFSVQFANSSGEITTTEPGEEIINENTNKTIFQDFSITPTFDPIAGTQLSYVLKILVVDHGLNFKITHVTREYNPTRNNIEAGQIVVTWQSVDASTHTITINYTYNYASKTISFSGISSNVDIVYIQVNTTMRINTSSVPSYTFGTRTELQTQYGSYSLAAGLQNSATGSQSIALGTGNISSGRNAFSINSFNTASGEASFAEGGNTMASGDYSHAAGSHTTAAGDNQFVIGNYNVIDSNNKYAFIIGNGAENELLNIFTVDWDGVIDSHVRSFTPTTYEAGASLGNSHFVVSAGMAHIGYFGENKAHEKEVQLFTLPVGIRPTYNVYAPFTGYGTVFGVVRIGTDGVCKVSWISNTTASARVFLNCSYPVV